MKQVQFISAIALAAAAFGAVAADEPRPGTTRAERMGVPQSGHYTSFAQLDANKGGVISRDEAKNSPALTRRFNELDTNRDGRLSQVELKDWSFYGPAPTITGSIPEPGTSRGSNPTD